MSDDDSSSGDCGGCGCLIALLILGVLVLSIGPAIREIRDDVREIKIIIEHSEAAP